MFYFFLSLNKYNNTHNQPFAALCTSFGAKIFNRAIVACYRLLRHDAAMFLLHPSHCALSTLNY